MAQDSPSSSPPKVVSDTDIQAKRVSRYMSERVAPIPRFSIKNRISSDCVTFSCTGSPPFFNRIHKYSVRGAFSLPPGRFNLPQLVTLFDVVHTTFGLYSFEEYNCYWFAITIYNSLLGIVGLDLAAAAPRGVGQLVFGGKLKTYSIPGTWNLSHFVESYHTEWAEAQERIAAAREASERPIREAQEDARKESECSASTLRRANAVHPIASVEIKVSPFAYEAETQKDISTAAELKILVLAYSPQGAGFLTGKIHIHSDIDPNDFRSHFDRFQPENVHHNIKLVDSLTEIAKKRGVISGQLSIAWVASQGSTSGRRGKIKRLEAEFARIPKPSENPSMTGSRCN